jgi:hypothetical protein
MWVPNIMTRMRIGCLLGRNRPQKARRNDMDEILEDLQAALQLWLDESELTDELDAPTGI